MPCVEMPGVVCLCPPLDGYDTRPPLEVASTRRDYEANRWENPSI